MDRRFIVSRRGDVWHAEPAFQFFENSLGVQWRGHIENADELACELQSLGYNPTADNAASMFARAYTAWGIDFTSHMDGSFSVAIWDRPREILVLGSDELGMNPLFFQEQGAFRASSHLQSLVAQEDRANLDEDYIADYIVNCGHFQHRTPFERFRRLPPRSVLVVRPNSIWTVRHVRPVSSTPEKFSEPGDYVAACRDVILGAVKGSIGSDDSVLCELSGGLDSSTVFGASKLLHSHGVTPFSYTYSRSQEADESPYISAMVQDGRWEQIDVDDHLPFNGEFPNYQAEPSLELLNASRLMAFDALCGSLKVAAVLTGIGGDTLFFGDRQPDHLADMLRRLKLISLWREARLWKMSVDEQRSMSHWLIHHAVAPALAWQRNAAIERETAIAPWLKRDYVAELKLESRRQRSIMRKSSTVFSTRWKEKLQFAAYGVSMRYQRWPGGPDYRHPLLSRKMRDFMIELPLHLQISPKVDRLLQRHAIEGMVPDIIRHRRSKGGPDQAFFRGLRSSSHWRQKLTEDPEVVRRGYVDREAWRRAVSQAALGYVDSLRQFQATASLEAWLQQS